MRSNILISPSKLLRVELHILFWVLIISFYTFFYGRLSGEYFVTFVHLLFTFPIYLAATYFTLYHIIPKYLLKKNYKAFIIASIYVVLGAAFLEILLTIVIIISPNLFGDYRPRHVPEFKALDIYLRLIGIFIVVFFASSIKLLKHWYVIQRTNQLLEKEKLQAELNFLKSQINPHFLFNTLNNLYSLTLKKSDSSPEVVLKLSEILDYMLYECSSEKVSLEKEISLVKNYIDLEKLRFGERFNIKLQIEGKPAGINVAPLLLFPLVENSFKHGVRRDAENSWVKIDLTVKRDEVVFEVSNKIASEKTGDNIPGGIGLENLKKRLDILYPGRHEFSIKEDSYEFKAVLKLNLGMK